MVLKRSILPAGDNGNLEMMIVKMGKGYATATDICACVSASIYNKNSLESGDRRNLPQHNKGHVQQTDGKHSQW